MKSTEAFAFLQEKRKLLEPFLLGDSSRTFALSFAHIAQAGAKAIARLPSKVIQEIDQSLDEAIAEQVEDDDATAIRAQLREKFGFSSLGDEPLSILVRISKTGKIKGEEEAALVDRFLSGDFGAWRDERRSLDNLQEIARDYYSKLRPM